MKSTELIKKLQKLDAGPDDGDSPCEVIVVGEVGNYKIINVLDFYPKDSDKIIIIQIQGEI